VNGIDVQRPVQVLPANASYSDAVAVNNVLYVTTSEGCGGAPNAVWAVDLGSDARTVTSWKTNGGRPVGPVAITPDGTPLVAIGPGTAAAGGYANAIVALDPKTLQPKDWFTHRTAAFVSAPLVFRQSSRDLVAAATRDGRILLLDARSLGGANHSTPLVASQPIAASPDFAPLALAMWQDTALAPSASGAAGGAPTAPAVAQPGATWLLAPVAGQLGRRARASAGPITNGAIVALRVLDRGGRPSLQPGWTSRDMAGPLAPIVVNDVVFAATAGSGASVPAVLYALDGRTGKELWTSGRTIASPISGRSLWAANSQAYVATQNGTVYAFGFTLERR
jgi:outer membrane protein assembly factor BamB